MASSNASAPERFARSLALAMAFVAAAAVVAGAAGKSGDESPAASAKPESTSQSSGTPPAAAPLPGNDLSSLLRGMRSATGVVAEFTETKTLALLSSPLEAKGTIYFLPPDRLVRTVTSPGRSRLVVDGDKVRFEEETGHRNFDLSASPIARQMIDSFVVLFNGDEKRLKELYTVEFTAEAGTWRLHLVPRSMPLSRMVASFDLAGSGPRIDRMVSAEPDGDRTVTVFGKTDSAHRFSEEEIATLFGEPPAP